MAGRDDADATVHEEGRHDGVKYAAAAQLRVGLDVDLTGTEGQLTVLVQGHAVRVWPLGAVGGPLYPAADSFPWRGAGLVRRA